MRTPEVLFWLRIAQGEDGVGEGRIVDGTAAAQDRPPAAERVRSAAALRRRLREEPGAEPGP